MSHDVALIGAGPGGLFAAWKLSKSDLDVIVIDKGDKPKNREGGIHGIGGAGTFSDGKLNLTPKIGGNSSTFNRTDREVKEKIKEIDSIFSDLGVKENYSGNNGEQLKKLKKKASEYGLEFVVGKQRHVGTDILPSIMEEFYKRLKEAGIKFKLNTEVQEIDKSENKFILHTDEENIESDYLLAAPGRAGSYWFRNQAENLGIEYEYGPIDVGVRLEFPSEVYQEIKEVMYDAKLRLYTQTYDDLVRTFCTNPNGFISSEDYEGFKLVNGHSKENSGSENTNLALLSRLKLTNPVEDTTKYGRAIANLANTIGGGKPLIQRLKDLRKGRRSYWDRIENSTVTPTLKEVTPGDISLSLPERIVTNLLEGIEKLNQLIPGIGSGNTLVYAPEIKFYDTKYKVNKSLETSVSNLYVAGDASGHSRGIVFSGVTGILAAESIIKQEV